MTDLLKQINDGPEMRAKIVAHVLSISIPSQIRVMREDRGWTQQQLAEKTNLKQSQIARVEKPGGGLSVSLRTLETIAIAFDVALIVKFSSWSEFIKYAAGLMPPSFMEVVSAEDKPND